MSNPGGVQVTPAYLAWTDDAGNLQQFKCFVKAEDYDFAAEVSEHPVETGSNITDNVRVKTDEASISFFETDSPLEQNNWTTVAPGIQVISVPSQIPLFAGPIPGPLPATFTAWDNLSTELALAAEAGGLVGGAIAGNKGAAVGALGVGILGEALVGSGVPVQLPFPPGLSPQPSQLTQTQQTYSLQSLMFVPNTNGLGLVAADGTPITLTAYVALTIALLRQLLSNVQVMNLIAPYLEIDNVVIQKIHIHRDADTGRAAEIEVGLKQIRFVTTVDVPAPSIAFQRAAATVDKGEQGTSDADASALTESVLHTGLNYAFAQLRKLRGG